MANIDKNYLFLDWLSTIGHYDRKLKIRHAHKLRGMANLFSALLFPAAFPSAFTRTRFASLFPATPSTFFPSALVGFIHRRPGAAFRLFAADAPLLVTTFNLRRLSFLLRCVFLFASACHAYLQFKLLDFFKLLDIRTNFTRQLDLI